MFKNIELYVQESYSTCRCSDVNFFPSATIDFLFNIVLAKYYDHSKSRNIF